MNTADWITGSLALLSYGLFILGLSHGGSGGTGGDRLSKFISGKSLKPYVSNKLLNVTENPMLFRTLSGNTAHGYEATVLVDICEIVRESWSGFYA